MDDARLEGDHERVEVKSTLPFKINIHTYGPGFRIATNFLIIILIEGTSVRRCKSVASKPSKTGRSGLALAPLPGQVAAEALLRLGVGQGCALLLTKERC